jgi:hypothetical protein
MITLDDHDTRRAMTLPAACEWLGRQTGKTPATSTIWRWTLKGVRGGIRLESFRIGGTTYTTAEMLARFIRRTSSNAVEVAVSPAGVEVSPIGDQQRRREQIASAQHRLKEICAPRQRGTRARHAGHGRGVIERPNQGRSEANG